MDRRSFLNRSGLALGTSLVLPSFARQKSQHLLLDTWEGIRSQFRFASGKIPMSQMLLASHPKWVNDAIEIHRIRFDENPVEYWEENWIKLEKRARESAAAYLKADPQEIMLTDSTTMGLGLLYTGLKLKEGDEILTTTHDHYSTEKSLEYGALKNKASIRRIALYTDPADTSAEEMVDKMVKAIKANTKIVAVTWVHSCTGMKLPIRLLAEAIKKVNEKRAREQRIYFCVDGVHGFGIENVTMEDLGCDFFAAGTHKWIFGPRGTGILWGKRDAWDMVVPTVPAFSEISVNMWLGVMPESKINFSDLHSPGGFHSFEHRWALNEAFDFHLRIGKNKIEQRTHYLNSMLKEGLKEMKHVKLHTPLSAKLSAAINCFDVDGLRPEEVVKKLHAKNIIANTSPYKISYTRLTPCMINSEEEVKACLDAIAGLKS